MVAARTSGATPSSNQKTTQFDHEIVRRVKPAEFAGAQRLAWSGRARPLRYDRQREGFFRRSLQFERRRDGQRANDGAATLLRTRQRILAALLIRIARYLAATATDVATTSTATRLWRLIVGRARVRKTVSLWGTKRLIAAVGTDASEWQPPADQRERRHQAGHEYSIATTQCATHRTAPKISSLRTSPTGDLTQPSSKEASANNSPPDCPQ